MMPITTNAANLPVPHSFEAEAQANEWGFSPSRLGHGVLSVLGLAVACLFLVSTSPARAGLLAYESFNYTNGASLEAQNGGIGFSGAWGAITNGTITISSGLTYSGLSTTGGSAYLTPTAAAVSDRRTLTSTYNSGTIYMSTLINVDSGTRYIAPFLAVSNGTAVLQFGQKTGSTNWSITNSNATNTANISVESSVPIVADTTYLLVLRVDFDASGVQDRIRLYVNPTLSAEPGTAQIDTLTTYDLGTITALGLQAAYTNGGFVTAQGSIDEIRLGSDYLSVVPEPTSQQLLGMVGGFLILVMLGHKRAKARTTAR